jgi:hypothetical protein
VKSQRRPCERFAAPVLDAVTCQDIKTSGQRPRLPPRWQRPIGAGVRYIARAGGRDYPRSISPSTAVLSFSGTDLGGDTSSERIVGSAVLPVEAKVRALTLRL